MIKVLIADDQVPKRGLGSEAKIKSYYFKKYKDIEFAEGFVFFSKLIRTLKSQGYKVDAVNKQTDVIKAVKNVEYDVIVLDLGWWTETKLLYDDKMVLGWELNEQIQKLTAAPVIMVSNRFFDDHELARTATEKGLLPLYKSYDEACIRQIVVAIRYAVFVKPPIKETVITEHKKYAFKMYKRLSVILLGAIMASVTLLLISVAFAVINPTSASIISSVFGFVLSFINGAIYRYIQQYKKDFTEERQVLEGQ